MAFAGVFRNPALIATIVAWVLAQILKMPLAYRQDRHWDWALLLRAGGMPSSHAALVTAAAHATGLTAGFDSPAFAVATALAVIVIYDATGIRRQAGLHAEMINAIARDLIEGHPLRSRERLLEVLGHSPLEAIVGFLLGLASAQIVVTLFTRTAP